MSAQRLHPTKFGHGALVFVLLLQSFLLGGASFSHLERPLTSSPSAQNRPTVDTLPLPLQYAFSSDVGRDDPAYHLSPFSPAGYAAANPRSGLAATFTSAAMRVRVGRDSWSIALTAWGRPANLQPLRPAGPALLRANRVEYPHGPLTAWYVNGPLGVQQGWTLAAPPPGATAAPVTLALAQGGTLRGQVDADRRGLTLSDAAGVPRLHYAGLLAHDAAGRPLPAELAAQGEQVLLRVDDSAALYPLTIDPWVQVSKLTTSSGADYDQMGFSVATSADGITVVASAPQNAAGGLYRGAVYVYVRPASGWATTPLYTAKLTASDGADIDLLGYSVAVGRDGDIVVAGALYNDAGGTNRGAAYIYLRPAGGWMDATQTAKLTAGSGGDNDELGYSVAVSGDGTTVVAGAPYNAAGGAQRGAAYVYVRPAGGWASTAIFNAKLTASDAADNDRLGTSVAVSADGGTVVAGAPYNAAGGTQRGATYVYIRPAGGWASTAAFNAKLTASGGADGDRLGWSVALSGDGGTVVAGAVYNDAGGTNRGAAYVYVRPTVGWASTSAFNAKLTASDGEDNDELGYSVAVSGDGTTVVTGAPYNAAGGDDRGAAYVYLRPTGGWASTAAFNAKLTAIDGADTDQLGHSVAVSGDNRTVVAGALYNDAGGTNRGAAYIYLRPAGGWASTVAKAKLTASDGADYDELGTSVALSADGTTVVAGAPHNAAGGTRRGATYVYVRPAGGWASTAIFSAKLTASDAADNDEMGSSVAVSADGDTVVAGAPYNAAGGTQRGAAYVYLRPASGWASTPAFNAKLTASDGADNDWLGYFVALSADGGTAVAGAPLSAAGGFDRGAAYVYVRPTVGWASTSAFDAKLTAIDGQDNDYLGFSVALSADGRTLVAGVPYNNSGGTNRGAAYVYLRPAGGWANTVAKAKLTASDGADNDELGYSVAVSGDGSAVFAGAPYNAAGGDDRGAVYVYLYPASGWASTSSFNAKLTAGIGKDGDRLGKSVAVSGDGGTVVAGAPGNPAGGTKRGVVYVYLRPAGGWATTSAFSAKMTASDGADNDWLGWSVALGGHGHTVVAGAPYNDAWGIDRGAVYVYAPFLVHLPLVLRGCQP